VARGVADVLQIVVFAARTQTPLCGRGALVGPDFPAKNTSLNCTMPELVKSSVGSFAGTSGLEATTAWPPLFRKTSETSP